MAIEKEYLTRYGWIAPKAYFRIVDAHKSLTSDNTCHARVLIYQNINKRHDNPDKPLAINTINFEFDHNSYNDNLSELDNLKTFGYNHLKNLTRSFRESSNDV